MKKKTLPVQLYQGSKLLLVCVEDSEAIEAYAETQNIEIPEDKDLIEGLFVKSGEKFYIIFHKNTSIGNISHEVCHFMNSLYKAIGQVLDPDNDEAYCHMLGHYIDECIKLK
jgi:hypothetical protein